MVAYADTADEDTSTGPPSLATWLPQVMPLQIANMPPLSADVSRSLLEAHRDHNRSASTSCLGSTFIAVCGLFVMAMPSMPDHGG